MLADQRIETVVRHQAAEAVVPQKGRSLWMDAGRRFVRNLLSCGNPIKPRSVHSERSSE